MEKSESGFVRSAEDTHTLMQVALGNEAADLALVNAKVLNVYTGEILNNYSVCIWDRWIAFVGINPEGSIRNQTRVIDVGGKTLIPGLIDGHTHIAWLMTPEAFLKYAMGGGTTTIVTETLEPYPVAGLAGVIDFLESLKNQPIKIFATAPAMASTSRTAAGISIKDLQTLLKRDEVIGLGESYWQAVQQKPEHFLPALTETLNTRKTLEGHSAGAGEKKLMGYLTTGISSCHEPIKAKEVLDRLRLGLHVMVREGSIRRDLEEIAKIKDMEVGLRRLILVSDGIEPGELIEKGYMEYIVQKAIDCGINPIDAIQMATLNVTEHFRLDHIIGGIAPGRYADIVVIPDARTIRAELVVSNGKLIARDNKLLEAPRPHTFAKKSLNSIRITERINPQDFIIRAPKGGKAFRVRGIGMATSLVTQERVLTVPVTDGEIRPDVGRDILKVAAVDRTVSPGKTFTGLIQGLGLNSGALACSAAWDTSDIIVVGADEADMALAVNRISELQGGAVLCKNGKILAELPLPIFGIMSNLPLEEIDRKIKSITAGARDLGVPFPDPVLTLITLTGAAIPFLRICEEGLVNLKDGKTVALFCD